MANINNALVLKKDVVFGGAVQTDWYYDNEKLKKVSENFIFHGPNFFGVTEDDVEFKTHKLMDTCSYVEMIANKLASDEGNPIILTIAGYGTGKSHLAVTLGALFSGDNDDLLSKKVIKQIEDADKNIADRIKSQITKPNLVIVLNGMKDFNLNYEILNTAKMVLKNHGYGEEIFSEYTKAYNIAKIFVERNFENLEEYFVKYSKEHNITAKDLKKYLIDNIYKDEVFDSINEVYKFFTGNYIRWDEGVSASDVLKNIVDKMCGDNGVFNKVLILFDEFGRYIEYASEYPNRAGDSALQQIFESVQDCNNNIIFVGFIQSDLKTYLSRVNKTSNISRYIGRYEVGEKIYLSSNLETIFANLLSVNDEHIYNKYILSKFNKEKVIEENEILFNKIGEWLPTSKNRGIWKDKNKFDEILLRKVYPFNPLTTWMLTYLSDWYQQRSAINFLMKSFEQIEEKEITELGSLPQILPIDIVKGEFFEELLLAENEGRKKSENCIVYNNINIKYKEKLSKIELDVLSGILILKLGKFKTSSREDALIALKYIIGQPASFIENSIEELENSYGIIEYDSKNNTFDFIEDAMGVNDFKRFLKNKKLAIKNVEVEVLLNNNIKEKLGLLKPIEVKFGKLNNIKTNEWSYKQDLITSKRIDEVFLKNLKRDIEASTSPDKSKGQFIYVYNNSEYGINSIDDIISNYNKLNLSNFPIIFLLLDDKENEFLEALINIDIISKFTEEERIKFAKFIPKFVESADNRIEQIFRDIRDEKLIITGEGIKKTNYRLRELCDDKFNILYNRAIPFPFDGFDKKSITAAKKIHSSICKNILSKSLNYQWLQLQNKELQNRVSIVLENEFLGWGVVDENYEIRYPQNIKLQTIFNEIDFILEQKNEVNIYFLYEKYIKAPYGMNDYSFSMMLSVYIAVKSLEVKIFENERPIKTIDWATNFFKERSLDFKYLKFIKIEKVNLEEYELRYKTICEKIEKNIYVTLCPKLKKELENLLLEENPNENFEIRVEACKRMVTQGYNLNEKVTRDIAKMRANLEKAEERLEFKYISPIIIECEEKGTVIEEGLRYVYDKNQMESFGKIASHGRHLIEKNYELFLKNNAKCRNIASLSGYQKWMEKLANDLEKLEYIDLARKTRSRLEQEIENSKSIIQRQTIDSDIKNYLNIIDINEYTPQESLLEWKKGSIEYIEKIKTNKFIDKPDRELYITALNCKLEVINKSLEKINESITEIIDKALDLKNKEEANNLIIDIKLLLEKKLRKSDRVDIEEIGEGIQLLLDDIEEIEILQSFKQIKEEVLKLKIKYKEYEENQIISIDSIIKGYIESIDLKIKKLNNKWIENNLDISEKIISTWDSEKCFAWIKSTIGLPEYLLEDTVIMYNKFKKIVDDRVSELNIESIITIFNSLPENGKLDCIKQLNKLIK